MLSFFDLQLFLISKKNALKRYIIGGAVTNIEKSAEAEIDNPDCSLKNCLGKK